MAFKLFNVLFYEPQRVKTTKASCAAGICCMRKSASHNTFKKQTTGDKFVNQIFDFSIAARDRHTPRVKLKLISQLNRIIARIFTLIIAVNLPSLSFCFIVPLFYV